MDKFLRSVRYWWTGPKQDAPTLEVFDPTSSYATNNPIHWDFSSMLESFRLPELNVYRSSAPQRVVKVADSYRLNLTIATEGKIVSFFNLMTKMSTRHDYIRVQFAKSFIRCKDRLDSEWIMLITTRGFCSNYGLRVELLSRIGVLLDVTAEHALAFCASEMAMELMRQTQNILVYQSEDDYRLYKETLANMTQQVECLNYVLERIPSVSHYFVDSKGSIFLNRSTDFRPTNYIMVTDPNFFPNIHNITLDKIGNLRPSLVKEFAHVNHRDYFGPLIVDPGSLYSTDVPQSPLSVVGEAIYNNRAPLIAAAVVGTFCLIGVWGKET